MTCVHGSTGPHRIELTDTPLGILVIDCDGPDTNLYGEEPIDAMPSPFTRRIRETLPETS